MNSNEYKVFRNMERYRKHNERRHACEAVQAVRIYEGAKY